MALKNIGGWGMFVPEYEGVETMGKGIRQVLGVKTPDEEVEDIMKKADRSTVEGRQKMMDDIRAVDPEAWKILAPQHQEYELNLSKAESYRQQTETTAQTAADKRLARTNRPKLATQFKFQQKPIEIQNWLKQLAPEADVSAIDSEAKATMFISKHIKDKGERSRLNKQLQSDIKQAEEMYIANRLYSPDVEDVSAKFKVQPSSMFTDTAADQAAKLDNTGTVEHVVPRDGVPSGRPFFQWNNPYKGTIDRSNIPTLNELPEDEIY